MAKLTLTLACAATDRSRPILDGRVTVPGVDLVCLPGEPEDIFARAMQGAPFEITELSMGSHIVTTARGDAPYVGLPVFLSRAFRHTAVTIRTDRAIAGPKDLAGKTIGLPQYQQTAALWVRGILRDHYGVDTRAIAWRTGQERTPISLPPGHDVAPLGRDLNAALAEGALDGMVSPRPPACLVNASAPVARLWPDAMKEEMAWYKASGFFPIMHCLALRRDVAEKHPWLPVELFRAFARARAMALAELSLNNVLRVSLPWIAESYRQQAAIMGGDPWPYGFARNRKEIAAMIRYAVEDGLAQQAIPPEALFHASTLGQVA
jgi:4,5-dihydroxyphthalate decarboxylase